ncbi:BlaI/MecI/CopY family transcriptional regulator [Plantibacter sp. Mn2098]|uniref:BlaI/MecI/CopY family transcriptional regulator n=1 Tax=Plantibacter sp. Mn2098 TaxID=3395266 RepID=UPI003BC81F37
MAERRPRGELESLVLKALWSSSTPLSARDLQGTFDDPEATPALTTLLTVLDRLVKKGNVIKEPAAGAGFVFSAAESESSYAADSMVTALLSSSDRSAALLRFAGQLGDQDVEALRKALGPDASAADAE